MKTCSGFARTNLGESGEIGRRNRFRSCRRKRRVGSSPISRTIGFFPVPAPPGFLFLPFYIGATRIGVPLIARFYRRHAFFGGRFRFSSCMLDLTKSRVFFSELTSFENELSESFLRGYP